MNWPRGWRKKQSACPQGRRRRHMRILKAENPDFVGWIKIEGTSVNYPVVQTKAEPQYYLRRSFEGSYSIAGTPFLDAQCDMEKGIGLIIYGHNMKDGSMFADLAKYRSKDFWQAHKTVWFDTALGGSAYEIFAVIHTTVQADAADAIPFYLFVDAAAPEDLPIMCRPAKRGRCTTQAFPLSTATSCLRFPPATTLPITADGL